MCTKAKGRALEKQVVTSTSELRLNSYIDLKVKTCAIHEYISHSQDVVVPKKRALRRDEKSIVSLACSPKRHKEAFTLAIHDMIDNCDHYKQLAKLISVRDKRKEALAPFESTS
ncbi:hypothetical protein O181_015479 [Austropuccinia psidii MF-1]|uniref:Uncharacterized protein n=1 Tax=Austropuccinia psidii MF-1 TaxID=1389203 RepID=A0A9Q3GQW2_9BASI|nr:hypothetical protein [Austropuccinia psidii MF-1]